MRCYTFRHDVKGFGFILTKGQHVLVVHESECLLPSHRAAVESPTAIAFARRRHKRTHNHLLFYRKSILKYSIALHAVVLGLLSRVSFHSIDGRCLRVSCEQHTILLIKNTSRTRRKPYWKSCQRCTCFDVFVFGVSAFSEEV